MSTQATTSGSNQVLPGTKIKRFLNYGLVAIASMVVGLIIGFMVLPRMSIEAGATAPPVRPQMVRNQPQHPDLVAQELRPFKAEAARYTGLAEFYSTTQGARSLQAETDRYTGLAEFYSPDISPSLAANPELMVAQHYTTAVDNETGEPATFDTEVLHTQYFNEWRIEVDSVDPGLTHSHPVILANNPELSLASRYSDYVQWRRIHHPGR